MFPLTESDLLWIIPTFSVQGLHHISVLLDMPIRRDLTEVCVIVQIFLSGGFFSVLFASVVNCLLFLFIFSALIFQHRKENHTHDDVVVCHQGWQIRCGQDYRCCICMGFLWRWVCVWQHSWALFAYTLDGTRESDGWILWHAHRCGEPSP